MPPEIRVLHPGDAAHVQEFVRRLSAHSRRERYFAPIRELTPRQLERVMLLRDPRDLALAAFHGERIVAVAECVAGEFGIVVADEWQGSGLGQELVQRLLSHARDSGLPSLHGLVRAGNRPMLRLARRLGFSAARDEDPALVRVELPLRRRQERRLLAGEYL